MEGEKHYQPVIAPEANVEEEVKPILDASLCGKTEAELTQEQQEAEIEFEMKNLEDFLEQIDKEEVMLHATSNPIKLVLASGIKSMGQRGIMREKVQDPELKKLMHKGKAGDLQFQRQTSRFLMEEIVRPYAEFLIQKPDEAKLEEVRGTFLKKLPEIGRKRVAWFLDNTLPKFIEAGLDPNYLDQAIHKWDAHDAEASAFLGGMTAESKGNVFEIPEKSKAENEDQYNARVNPYLWWQLVSMIGGVDLVSATPAKYLKQNKLRGVRYGSVEIFFETPDEIRRYNLDHAQHANDKDKKWDEDTTHDIGVSNSITPGHFKAIGLGVYDHENRILYLPENVQLDDVENLRKFQNRGVKFFDRNMISLPPLESLRIVKVGDKEALSSGTKSDDNPEAKLIKELAAKNTTKSDEQISKIIKEKGYKWGKDQEKNIG